MITDLEKIKQLGVENEEDNFRFRSWLKMQDSKKIDRIVNRLYQHYLQQINCTTCGNCCTLLQPLITKKDITRIIRILAMPENELMRKYIETDSDGDMRFKDTPCHFLEIKKCKIYSSRPFDCRSYPHLHKKDFNTRLFGVIQNYSVCPIVFNVYEDLKLRLGF